MRVVCALALALALGCNGNSRNTVLVVKVSLAFQGAGADAINALEVTVEDGSHKATREFVRSGAKPLTFPATFGIELGLEVTGPVRIEVRGVDRTQEPGRLVGRGLIEAQKITAGKTQTTSLWLECISGCAPLADAGVDGRGSDARADAGPTGAMCGNGRIDPGETCDLGIAADKPGGCPAASCDDTIACTMDTRMGTGCSSQCLYTEIRNFAMGDGCCPANGTSATDPDCSATCGNGTIEPGETCDRGIMPAGRPGSCPVAAACQDKDACTQDILISGNTCSARCVHRTVNAFIAGDGCCAAGATHNTDSDCPVVCGNAIFETGEMCDTAIPAGMLGSCPTTCKDSDVCTRDTKEGSGCNAVCKFSTITAYLGGDGCCPSGGNRNVDTDCPAKCGNGVVEAMETCDNGIPPGRPGACPSSCAADPSGCMPRMLQGSAVDCTARCTGSPITRCIAARDGCCPMNCTAINDGDCSPTCGNGVVEPPGETCDTKIAEGSTGACPTRCDDGMTCTTDMLVSAGTCSARCQNTAITTPSPGDGCCPPGGNHNLDSDCPAICGNSIVEPTPESCDRSIAAGMPGACPTMCPAPSSCKQYTFAGTAAMCSARCDEQPISMCVVGDSCCPLGCNHNNDADCTVVCGNAVVETGETCDKGITAGNPGACAATCEDNDPCTSETTAGRVEDCTRTCTYAPITACSAGDRCCPSGCNVGTDADCGTICGNNVVEKGETCDPPSSCPTTCPDDGDLCTKDVVTGSQTSCNAACSHPPITACSGQMMDGCCPTGCSANPDAGPFDADCRN